VCTGAEAIPLVSAIVGAGGQVGSSLINRGAGTGAGGGGGGGFVDKPKTDILGIFDQLSNPAGAGTPGFNPNAPDPRAKYGYFGPNGIGGMAAPGGLLGMGENLLQAWLMKKLFGGGNKPTAAPAPATV